MPEKPIHHILLLPQDDYWEWVSAARDYAVQFGVAVTPLPEKAIHFHAPDLIISVVNAPGGYPGHNDIAGWLKSRAPAARVDVLDARFPEELRQMLSTRI